MKVLITAFKPFNKMRNNYSMEVLEYLDGVDKLVIDVLYDRSYNEIEETCNLEKYDLIIAMGEARIRKELTIEVLAKNIANCRIADNEGTLKKYEEIISGGKKELYTKVDLSKISDFVRLSQDAGTFVCNNVYYHLLLNYPEKSLFIHIPECNNDEKMYKEYALTIKQIINKLGGIL